jgi:hypothetical protein
MISPAVIVRAASHRQAFATAQPFRHLCIDDFFTAEAAAASLNDFPPFDREYARNEFGEYGGKAVINNIAGISPFYARLYDYLMSPGFLGAMSAITGIDNLHGDPTLYGGGTHENVNGQALDVHVDFNFQIEGGFHRRANLLLYLNREWDPAWGGAIELHSDPRRPEHDAFEQFNVTFNRAVIFETNERSWHGFRTIDLPQDRLHLSRKCLSIYLYTPDRPPEEIVGPHSTFYVQWPFPARFAVGRSLSTEDVAELRTGYARRDQQIAMYERVEERLSAELAEARLRHPSPAGAGDTAKDSCQLMIDFAGGSNPQPYFREGWAEPEEAHTWAVGQESRLVVPQPNVPGTYALTLEVRPHRWPDAPGQRLAVAVNDCEVGHFLVREAGELECLVAWSALMQRDPVSLVFRHPDAVRPREVGESADDRELALLFERLQLFRLCDAGEINRHGFRTPVPAGHRLQPRRPPPPIYLYAAKRPSQEMGAPQDGFFVAWPFPEKIAPGRVLSSADVAELRAGYARRDRQIELYQQMEERLGRELQHIGEPRPKPKMAFETAGGRCELVVDFSRDGNARDHCGAGWSDPEERHTWTIGRSSSLELPRSSLAGDYAMTIELWPFRNPDMPGQRLTIVVNGSEVGEFIVVEKGVVDCAVPWPVLAAGDPVSVVFRHPDAAQPSALDDSSDHRELALCFETLRLVCRSDLSEAIAPP